MKKLVDISPVEPVHNKKGQVTGWKISATYLVVVPPERPSKLYFHSTKVQEYTFRNMFGWGYKLACKIQEKMLAKINEIQK